MEEREGKEGGKDLKRVFVIEGKEGQGREGKMRFGHSAVLSGVRFGIEKGSGEASMYSE